MQSFPCVLVGPVLPTHVGQRRNLYTYVMHSQGVAASLACESLAAGLQVPAILWHFSAAGV